MKLRQDGRLSGKPSKAGTFTFAVGATDACGNRGTAEYTLRVRPTPTVKVKPVAKLGKIKVDVNPSLPKAKYWRFTVEKLGSDGVTWKKWRSFKTKTKKEIR